MIKSELSVRLSLLVKDLLTEQNNNNSALSLEEIIKSTVWYKKEEEWEEQIFQHKTWDDKTTSCIKYKGWVLHLTGSRWFLKKARNRKTDYDFFTGYDEELIEHLRSLGFKEPYKMGDIYKDRDCTLVLRKEATDSFQQIDIQFVQHVAHRVLIRNLLDELGPEFWSTVDKWTASKLWDIGHHLAMVPSPFGSIESFHPLNSRVDWLD